MGFTCTAVVSSPIIYSVTDSDVSNVSDSGVEWSQPPGGATVTGYVVHYSHGVDNMTENAPVSSTNLSVSDLCSGFIYIFSVEATSVHLSGESPASTIAVGEEIIYICCKIIVLLSCLIIVVLYNS